MINQSGIIYLVFIKNQEAFQFKIQGQNMLRSYLNLTYVRTSCIGLSSSKNLFDVIEV